MTEDFVLIGFSVTRHAALFLSDYLHMTGKGKGCWGKNCLPLLKTEREQELAVSRTEHQKHLKYKCVSRSSLTAKKVELQCEIKKHQWYCGVKQDRLITEQILNKSWQVLFLRHFQAQEGLNEEDFEELVHHSLMCFDMSFRRVVLIDVNDVPAGSHEAASATANKRSICWCANPPI